MVSTVVLSIAVWAVSLRSTIMESLRSERGQGLVEYAVLIGAIGIVFAGALYFALPDFEDAVDSFVLDIQDCFYMEEACGDAGG